MLPDCGLSMELYCKPCCTTLSLHMGWISTCISPERWAVCTGVMGLPDIHACIATQQLIFIHGFEYFCIASFVLLCNVFIVVHVRTCEVPSFGGANKLTDRVYIIATVVCVSFCILLSYVYVRFLPCIHNCWLICCIPQDGWLLLGWIRHGVHPGLFGAAISYNTYSRPWVIETSYSVLYAIFVLLLGDINDIHDLGSVAEERTQLV